MVFVVIQILEKRKSYYLHLRKFFKRKEKFQKQFLKKWVAKSKIRKGYENIGHREFSKYVNCATTLINTIEKLQYKKVCEITESPKVWQQNIQ